MLPSNKINGYSKSSIFEALDKRRGKDLIVSVYEVKLMFKLSDQQFYPLYEEWRHSTDGNNKTI